MVADAHISSLGYLCYHSIEAHRSFTIPAIFSEVQLMFYNVILKPNLIGDEHKKL